MYRSPSAALLPQPFLASTIVETKYESWLVSSKGNLESELLYDRIRVPAVSGKGVSWCPQCWEINFWPQRLGGDGQRIEVLVCKDQGQCFS